MRKPPLRTVTAPVGQRETRHKCACRVILIVTRGVITTCLCGRRYAISEGEAPRCRQVTIRGEE